jgi:hypothetical protein
LGNLLDVFDRDLFEHKFIVDSYLHVPAPHWRPTNEPHTGTIDNPRTITWRHRNGRRRRLCHLGRRSPHYR